MRDDKEIIYGTGRTTKLVRQRGYKHPRGNEIKANQEWSTRVEDPRENVGTSEDITR